MMHVILSVFLHVRTLYDACTDAGQCVLVYNAEAKKTDKIMKGCYNNVYRLRTSLDTKLT